jgi:hypothetical protein
MGSFLPEERKERIASYLAHQRTCIISTATAQGMWAMPVWYRTASGPSSSRALELDCLVPRWSDVAHCLTQDSRVVLIVQASSGVGLRWLQIRGTARPVEAPDWAGLLPRWISTTQPDALYLAVRVTPGRIDLVDEELGWGTQETLEW